MNSPALPPERHIDLRERLGLYARLVRLDKPIGTLLLLWPTLWALWIAGSGRPNLAVVAIFTAGTLLMRSAGCAINDFADRDIDPHVRRTADRPLAAGRIRPKEALAMAGVLSLIAFLLVLTLNRLTVGLSFVALFLAASYPFTKRFLALPQGYLGIAFGFGIPMAFAALLNELPAMCWWMLLANILWTVGYDTEYAMVDRDDDLRLGIRTSAILFGRHDVTAVAFCHAAFIAIMAGIGHAAGLGLGFMAALAVAGALLAWQIWRIRHRERDACFQAFLQNNRVGAVVFAGILAG
jgi:4-hydroxybenzoate polyprenyltransferase